MTKTATAIKPAAETAPDFAAIVRKLGEDFAARARTHDEAGSFVAENYEALKSAGLTAAAVPQELGGMGIAYPELCAMLRTLAQCCSSTALGLALHIRWRCQPGVGGTRRLPPSSRC